MADSTPLLPQMAAASDDREIIFNGIEDAGSPPSMYGRNYQTCTGLVFGYFGGRYNSSTIANGTVTATASNTNYFVAARSNGAVSISTANTNWNDTTNYIRLYLLTAGGSAVTAYEDHRQVYGWSSTAAITREIQIACSDLTTALTTGTSKAYFRAPRAMTIIGVQASLLTAQATNGAGGIVIVDINDSGTTILSTKLSFDNTEKTTTTAATPAVISDSAIASDAEVTVDIDQIGDGTATGLIVTILYT